MAFSYVEMMTELGHGEFARLPTFAPQARAEMRRPPRDATIGVLTSCGAHLMSQAPFKDANDLSYRLLPREVPAAEIKLGHPSPIRRLAEQDLNVAYPCDRMVELESEGTIGRLAPNAVSILGSITTYTELVEQTVPSIKREFDAAGVDLVLLLPFCPNCHRAVCVIARALEARGLPTVVITLLREMADAFKPARPLFLDFPLGATVGRPGEQELQRNILREAFRAVECFDGPWHVFQLPFQWTDDGSRTWEDDVRRIYYEQDRALHSERVAKHEATAEQLAGREDAFAIRCNC